MILRILLLAYVLASNSIALDHADEPNAMAEAEKEETIAVESALYWAYPHMFSLKRLASHCAWQSKEIDGPDVEQLKRAMEERRTEFHLQKCALMQKLQNKRHKRKREEETKSAIENAKTVVDQRASDGGGNLPKTSSNKKAKKNSHDVPVVVESSPIVSSLAERFTKEYRNYKSTYNTSYANISDEKFLSGLYPLLKTIQNRGSNDFFALEITRAIFTKESSYSTDISMHQNYVMPIVIFLCNYDYLTRYRHDMKTWRYRMTNKLKDLLERQMLELGLF